MTWATVRDALATMVEGATVATTSRGKPATLRHYPEASREVLPGDRGFWFELVGEAHSPRFSSGVHVFSVASVDLVIAYTDDTDREKLDEICSGDYAAIVRRLRNPSLWPSGVHGVGEQSPPAARDFVRTVERLDGAMLSVVRFSVLHS